MVYPIPFDIVPVEFVCVHRHWPKNRRKTDGEKSKGGHFQGHSQEVVMNFFPNMRRTVLTNPQLLLHLYVWYLGSDQFVISFLASSLQIHCLLLKKLRQQHKFCTRHKVAVYCFLPNPYFSRYLFLLHFNLSGPYESCWDPCVFVGVRRVKVGVGASTADRRLKPAAKVWISQSDSLGRGVVVVVLKRTESSCHHYKEECQAWLPAACLGSSNVTTLPDFTQALNHLKVHTL